MFYKYGDAHKDIIAFPRISSNDYLNLVYKDLNQNYIICNFYCLILYSLNFESKIIHINWISIRSFKDSIKIFFLLSFLLFSKVALRKKVYWTPHNLIPHDSSKSINSIVYNLMIKITDVVIVHGNYEKNKILEKYSRESVIYRHPNFLIPNSIDHSEKIYKKPEGLNFLIFGQILKYKGVEEIIDLWDSSWGNLTIAGCNKLNKVLPNKENIKYVDKFLSFDELCFLIKNCDFTIFNYQKITTSGSLILSKNIGTRVICVSKGNLLEYIDDDDFVYNSIQDFISIIQQIHENYIS